MEEISEEHLTELYDLPDHPDGSPRQLVAASPVPSTHGGHLDGGSEITNVTRGRSPDEVPPPIEKSADNRFSVMLAPSMPQKGSDVAAANHIDTGSSSHHGSSQHGGRSHASSVGRAEAQGSSGAYRGWTSETDVHVPPANGQSAKVQSSVIGSGAGDDVQQELPKIPRQVRQSTDTRVSQDTVRTYSKPSAAQSARMLARRSISKLRGRNSTNSFHDSTPKVSMDAGASFPFGSLGRAAPDSAKQKRENAGTQWASERNGGGDGNTIAQLYAVFGLPKDPSVWTLAEDDCVAGVQHIQGAVSRFWRPEVLGCSICPSPSEILGQSMSGGTQHETNGDSDPRNGAKSDGKDADGKKSSPKFIEMSDGRGGVEQAETARVLSKALKLSFTREVEVVVEQGQYPPPSTSHTFSFSVPTMPGGSEAQRLAGKVPVTGSRSGASQGVGEGYGVGAWNGAAGATANGDDMQGLATFYGVVLTVWSAADEKRAKMIRKELARAAKQRGSAKTGAASNGATAQDTTTSADYAAKSAGSIFFMPYAICIVSRYPLYNLLGDWNKMAWHKYSRNIEMHNQLMSTILRHPAPRLGEEISVGSPDKDLSLHGTFPGALEWGSGLTGIDFAMWPLFRTLSLENILTICEVALAHNGRILFLSRHPALLGMAVDSTRSLVEQRGWKGVTHQSCHARDVRIYLEDPGSWIIAIASELRSVADIAKEVCIVDLDINNVECARPPAHAISQGPMRQKRMRKLVAHVSNTSSEYVPPREFVDAYPGSRFRPLSRIITRDPNSAYQQLQEPAWWSQVAVVQAFNSVFQENAKQSLLKRLFKKQKARGASSEAEIAAINALRRRARTFVDARDGLENKIGRLNKRLAFLMSESEMWRAQFGKIQILVDRLTKEANELRGKVDKERRESRRLSTTLAQRDLEHVQLQVQLKETENARELAIGELKKMQTAMESVDREREAMMQEIREIVSGGGDADDINMRIPRLDVSKFNPLSRSTSPTSSQASMTPSQAAEYILKSRAMAEARINEGRPGRVDSRVGSESGHSSVVGGLTRSLSQDRGERARKGSVSGSVTSHTHAFPDENMNFEIQQRTSIVTDQISRIQQQLESTLTQLEGRRSGTYERDTERRLRSRRGSNASLASRYEYRSSLGHGSSVAPSVVGMRSDSVMTGGYASEDGHNSESADYEQIESVNDTDSRLNAAGRRRESRTNLLATPAHRAPLRDALAMSDSPEMGTTALAPSTLPPALTTKSHLRSPKNDNALALYSPPSSELVMGDPSHHADNSLRYEDIGGHNAQYADSGIEAETMIGSHDEPMLFSAEQVQNGVAHQPLLSAVTASGGHGSSGHHSVETTEESGPKSPADVPVALPRVAQAPQGTVNEVVLPAPGGWTMEVEQGKLAPETQVSS